MADNGRRDADRISDWFLAHPEKLAWLKAALLPLVKDRQQVENAGSYFQLLELLENRSTAELIEPLMHSALRAIHCDLANNTSYDPTTNEDIIQFELMLALVAVICQMSNRQHRDFRYLVKKEFHPINVPDNDSGPGLLVALYDRDIIATRNVPTFQLFLERLGCHILINNLKEFLIRNNIHCNQEHESK